MSPRVSPDIKPANKTKPTIISMCMKNSASQQRYSTAINFLLLLLLLLLLPVPQTSPPNPSLRQSNTTRQSSTTSIANHQLQTLTTTTSVRQRRERERKLRRGWSGSCVLYEGDVVFMNLIVDWMRFSSLQLRPYLWFLSGSRLFFSTYLFT